MRYFKLIVLGVSLAIFSNLYAASNDIPSAKSGISLSLTGLYLQPNAANLNYAVFTKPLPITTPNWSQVVLKPGYHPAFDLGIQYNFRDPANKINLNWFYMDASNSTSFSTSAANTSVAPPYYFGPLGQALVGTSAYSKAQFNISNVGLTFGRLIDLGYNIQLDPFAGIDLAYLKQMITTNYLGHDSLSTPYSITSYNTSKFTGIGPRLGVNATYYFTHFFGISARVGGALLAGSLESDTNFNSFGAGNTISAYTTLADQTENTIVPEVDAKLEASYMIPTSACGSSVTLAIGYLFMTYFNGIKQVVPTALVPGAFNGGTIAIETVGQDQSNLNLNGPYANIVWKF